MSSRKKSRAIHIRIPREALQPQPQPQPEPEPQTLDPECVNFLEQVKKDLLQASKSDRKRLVKYLGKCLTGFLHGEAASISLVHDVKTFQVSKSVVREEVKKQYSGKLNQLNVGTWKRSGSTEAKRVVVYIPAKARTPVHKRKYMNFRAGDVCNASNEDFIKFASKYINSIWEKLSNWREAKRWLWTNWPIKTNHPITEKIMDEYRIKFEEAKKKRKRKRKVKRKRKRGEEDEIGANFSL